MSIRPGSLYEAGWQATKVRGLVAFSAACALGACWAGVHVAATLGLSPADGGALRPWPERWAFGAGVSSLGVGFLAAMLVYARCYVVRVTADAAAPASVVLHPLWGAPVRVGRDDVQGHAWHDGRTGRVNAPWTSVRLRGRRLPLIVDGQGAWAPPGPPTWLG